MLLSHEIFLRIYDVLESVFDVEDAEVGTTDLALALMELTVRKMNMNPKKPSRLLQIGFHRKQTLRLRWRLV